MEQPPSERNRETLSASELVDTPDGLRIREGIAEALRDGTTIDHQIAQLIARTITPGSGAIEQLSQTGEITPEIGSDLEVCYQLLPDLADTWIAALDGLYLTYRPTGLN